MAYGNWGAIVRCNGERRPDHEDTDAFGVTYHALLGHGRVLLTGYKHYPVLLLEGHEVNLDPYLLDAEKETFEDRTWAGEIKGYKFRAEQYNGNMVDLYLREPNGDTWTATCGFEFGAGHMT